jgi:prolyl oligopeptidase
MPLIAPSYSPVEEMIHGALVLDPYRWLEDRSLPETEEWIRQQQGHCDAYFEDCPGLSVIRERVREYLDVEVVDQPARVGDRYFYRRRVRGQEQGCIYARSATTGEEKLLVDPSPEGPFVSVAIHRISAGGSLLAYERKHGGEDKKSIHVLDLKTGVQLPHNIRSGYARGFTFAIDNRGFFYCQETDPHSDQHEIVLHLFDESVEDQTIFRVTRSGGSRLMLTADAFHLGAIHIHRVDGQGLIDFWIASRSLPANWHRVFAGRGLPFSPILKQGRIFALSYERASNGKLIELNLRGEEVRTVIPMQGAMVRQLTIAGDTVLVNSLDGMVPSIRRWSLDGDDRGYLEIPPDGTVQLLSNQTDDDVSFFHTHESFAHPPTIFEYNILHEWIRPWHTRAASCPDISVLETPFSSKDGSEIPLTLVVPKQRSVDQQGPVIMTSYGGFGVSMTPQFSVLVTIMIELGVVFALPHIRGGGEFGREWHEAARGRGRQVAFDDFIAAADWLCGEGITTPERLGMFGGSNSGLLVGVALTQRPELFRAAICIAPLLDMVRYELFDQAVRWRNEYGTVDDPEDFAALHAYSPYHHIEDNTNYPAVLFVSGDNDDRCNPAHVRKAAARLRSRDSQLAPILLDYRGERGHSPVLPLSVRIEALTRRIAFLCREMNIPVAFGGSHEAICA